MPFSTVRMVNISGASKQNRIKVFSRTTEADGETTFSRSQMYLRLSYLHPWRAAEFVHHLTSSSWAAAVKLLALGCKLKVFSNHCGISGASGDLDYIKQAVCKTSPRRLQLIRRMLECRFAVKLENILPPDFPSIWGGVDSGTTLHNLSFNLP